MTKLTEEQREKKTAQNRKYYLNNKEKKLAYQKDRRQNNPEARKQYLEYLKNYFKTPNGKKKVTIGSWKKSGIIAYDWEQVYELYTTCDTCYYCNEPFDKPINKHLDHDHSITDRQNIRGILCRSCNITDKLKGMKL